MRPRDTVVKCPFTSTRLLSPYYTEKAYVPYVHQGPLLQLP